MVTREDFMALSRALGTTVWPYELHAFNPSCRRGYRGRPGTEEEEPAEDFAEFCEAV